MTTLLKMTNMKFYVCQKWQHWQNWQRCHQKNDQVYHKITFLSNVKSFWYPYQNTSFWMNINISWVDKILLEISLAGQSWKIPLGILYKSVTNLNPICFHCHISLISGTILMNLIYVKHIYMYFISSWYQIIWTRVQNHMVTNFRYPPGVWLDVYIVET